MKRQAREGIGWPLFPTPDDHGRLQWPTSQAQSVAEHIRVLLSTRQGELLGWAQYGAGLDTFLHEPDTVLVQRRIEDAITENLVQWEPRIELDQVEVSSQPDVPGVVHVEILYTLVRTGQAGRVALRLLQEG